MEIALPAELRVSPRGRPGKALFCTAFTLFGIRNEIGCQNFLLKTDTIFTLFGIIPSLDRGRFQMQSAGKSLRSLREKLGLTMRDVENSSARIADKYRNEEFSVPPSRLSDIET